MPTYIRRDLPRDVAVRLLTRQDACIRAFASAWPAPRWIKIWGDGDEHATMAWVNGAYASWYGIDPHLYIGQPDSAIWPPEVCARFRELDLQAISKAGEIVLGWEDTPRGPRPGALSRKFAFRVSEGDLCGWGIYGEVCPLDDSGCPFGG